MTSNSNNLQRLLAISTALAAAIAGMAWSGEAMAQDSVRQAFDAKFIQQVARISEETPGVVGVAVIDAESGEMLGVNHHLLFPSASSIKLLIDVTLYAEVSKGAIDLDTRILTTLGGRKSEYSLHEVSRYMIDKSDNDATNALIELLGMQKINAMAAALDLPSMVLRRRMLDQAASARGDENVSTPADAARFMLKMLRCELPMRVEVCESMKEVSFGAYPEGPVREQIPADVRVIQMPGGLDGVRNSWAAVDLPGRPFSLAIMGSFGTFERITESIRKITDVTYAYFDARANSSELGVRVRR